MNKISYVVTNRLVPQALEEVWNYLKLQKKKNPPGHG